jgi:hypothetical protein
VQKLSLFLSLFWLWLPTPLGPNWKLHVILFSSSFFFFFFLNHSTSKCRLKSHEISPSSFSFSILTHLPRWRKMTNLCHVLPPLDRPSTPSSWPARLAAHMAHCAFNLPKRPYSKWRSADPAQAHLQASESVLSRFQGCFCHFDPQLRAPNAKWFLDKFFRQGTVGKQMKRTRRRTVGATCHPLVGWELSFFP